MHYACSDLIYGPAHVSSQPSNYLSSKIYSLWTISINIKEYKTACTWPTLVTPAYTCPVQTIATSGHTAIVALHALGAASDRVVFDCFLGYPCSAHLATTLSSYWRYYPPSPTYVSVTTSIHCEPETYRGRASPRNTVADTLCPGHACFYVHILSFNVFVNCHQSLESWKCPFVRHTRNHHSNSRDFYVFVLSDRETLALCMHVGMFL